MRDNFEAFMDNYFDEFKIKMKNRMRNPKLVVDKYYDEICFIMDTDFVYAQVVIPRVVWLRPMPYEVNVDDILTTMTGLLA